MRFRMKARRHVLTLIALVLPWTGIVAPVQAGEEQEEAGGRIGGRVVMDARPVPATVVLRRRSDGRLAIGVAGLRHQFEGSVSWPLRSQATTTVTDAEGRFQLTDVPRGEYDVEAVHASGRRTWQGRRIAHPGHAHDLVLALPVEAHAITGTVRTVGGASFHGGAALVRACTERSGFEPESLLVLSPEGAFRADGLAPGRYAVAAFDGEQRHQSAPFVVPAAEPIAFVVGEGYVPKEGRVVDADGQPVAGADVWFTDYSLYWGRTSCDAEGTFSTAAPEGCNAWAFHGARCSEPMPWANTPVDLALPPVGSLRGSVRDDRGEPVPNADVLVMPVAAYNDSAWKSIPTRSDARGSFACEDVPLGTYLVVATAPGLASRRTVYSEGDWIQLTEAGAPVSADVVVHAAPGLSGQIVFPDGTGVRGAHVWATSNMYGFAFVPSMSTATDAEGRFSIDGVARGLQYTLFCEMGPDLPVLRKNVETPPAYEGREADVAWEVSTIRTLHVTVVGEDDAPIAGASVVLSDGPAWRALECTGLDGRARVRLFSGDWWLYVYAEGKLMKEAGSVPVAMMGPTRSVRVVMVPARAIGGRVLVKGRPAKGVLVSALDLKRQEYQTQHVETDEDGRFEIEGLRPGTYWITALRKEGPRSVEYGPRVQAATGSTIVLEIDD